ncbi:MAG: LD-carboxypeptidase [Bacteroidota bacterium]
MNRRSFSTTLCAALPALAFSSINFPLPMNAPAPKPRKANRLKKGDVIGLIAPGSALSDDKIQKAHQNLEAMGFSVKMGQHLSAQKGYLAGTDEQRLGDLHQMFADPQVKGIWCARGGYGCTRLLPSIDYRLIKNQPKVLIGYSDITALLQAIHCQTGLIGFHGPLASSDFNDYVVANLEAVLMEAREDVLLENAKANLDKEDPIYHPRIIASGQASGPLVGGNLSLIAAMSGTKYDWMVKNKLLFLEDIGEKPYRIDRMLTQLLQTHSLKKAAAIVLGIFSGCEAKEGDQSLSLMDTFKDRLSHLGIPVIYGMSFGHIDHQFVLPVGAKASLDTQTQRLRLLESAVQ